MESALTLSFLLFHHVQPISPSLWLHVSATARIRPAPHLQHEWAKHPSSPSLHENSCLLTGLPAFALSALTLHSSSSMGSRRNPFKHQVKIQVLCAKRSNHISPLSQCNNSATHTPGSLHCGGHTGSCSSYNTPSMLPPQSLCTCSSSVWNCNPPDMHMEDSFHSLRPLLKWLLSERTFISPNIK